MQKSIILATDNNYLIQVETTIKSILTHNTDVCIYVFNNDIAPEWFKLLNVKLVSANSQIINIRVDQNMFNSYKTGDLINYTTFFRYLIPDLVTSDRSLYLDCDLLVTGDLSELFHMDMEGKPVAAVASPYAWESDPYGFNAGVLLIDNNLWRSNSYISQLLKLTEEKQAEVAMADQSILNIFFQNNWKEIDSTYNYLVGLDYNYRGAELSRLEDSLPKIIHFAGTHKPWHTYSSTRLRELWWTYRDLDWLEVLSESPNLNYYHRVNQSKKQIFILTLAAKIEHIHYLVTSLPDWHFHLAAPCDCSEELTSLSQYTNVTVYQNVLHSRIDWLLDDSIVYLDINTGGEVFNVVTRAQESGKKIFAFDITRKSMDDGLYDGIFSVERPDDLVDRMKNIEIE
ncbi:glycosyltransferase family 8 protein [Streptococcus pneumoniae]|nr:glycosyltransferase family 8 protein [Streptococcus pneumoniae]